MSKFINKIVYGRLNPIFYFFWSKLKIRILFKRPKYLFGLILYILNYALLVLKSRSKVLPHLKKEYYFAEEIFVDDSFIDKVSGILSKPNAINFGKEKSGYVYYENYNQSYLDQVNINNDTEREFFLNFLNDKLGNKIRKIYGNNEYRVEHFWLIKTLNKNQEETYNLNSKFHTDPCMPGALKIIIYLCDVDELNGPFSVKNNNNIVKFVTGKKGTTIFFDPNRCMHAGSNTQKKERLAISYLLYPSIRKKFSILNEKPFLSDFTINPFTKYM